MRKLQRLEVGVAPLPMLHFAHGPLQERLTLRLEEGPQLRRRVPCGQRYFLLAAHVEVHERKLDVVEAAGEA